MIKRLLNIPKVFINYRRKDSSGHSGRIFDDLVDAFGRDYVIMDIDKFKGGDYYEKVIKEEITTANVLLVIIGNQWLSVAENGNRRIDDPEDLVRKEILMAFEAGRPIIPVLVQGTKMPTRDELPEDLKKLASIHSVEISDTRWPYDLNKLVENIRRVSSHRGFSKNNFLAFLLITILITALIVIITTGHWPSDKDLVNKNNNTGDGNGSLNEEKGSLFLAPNMAVFDSIKLKFIRDSLAKKSTLEESVRREKKEWNNALSSNTIDSYKAYQRKFPRGRYYREAQGSIIRLTIQERDKQDEIEWNAAIQQPSIVAYEKYKINNPDGRHVEEADKRIKFFPGKSYEGGIIFYVDSTGEHGLLGAKENLSDATNAHGIQKSVTAYRPGGFDGWRVPTRDELKLLFEKRDFFTGLKESFYWSSTTNGSNDIFWVRYFNDGREEFYNAKNYVYAVRLVRDFKAVN